MGKYGDNRLGGNSKVVANCDNLTHPELWGQDEDEGLKDYSSSSSPPRPDSMDSKSESVVG